MAHVCIFVCCVTSEDPTDPSIDYDWFDAGVLDYDTPTGLYFVQRVDENCRIVNPKGEMVSTEIISKGGKRARGGGGGGGGLENTGEHYYLTPSSES